MTIQIDRVCEPCCNNLVTLSWQVFANGTKHLRASCDRCGRFVVYLPQTDANLAALDAQTEEDVDDARAAGEGGFIEAPK
jgi:hypothetical protein